jgi:hypothetical protein
MTTPMKPINVKMLALRLRAMAESDLPKQAAQASAAGLQCSTHTAVRMAGKEKRFTGS